MTRRSRAICVVVCMGLPSACASVIGKPARSFSLTPEARLAILRRAQIWESTDIQSKDLKAGPQGSGAFAPGETITCQYVHRTLGGNSPKFQCAITPDDEIKVKFGQHNGEVYGEVAATRLLWALGFGADRMYPVRVICKGCPSKFGGTAQGHAGEVVVDPAAVERKASGKTIETRTDEGWTWRELDLVDEAAGGAPQAHRDALKLLAVLLQHGDNKPQQQRLSCLDKERDKERDQEPGSRTLQCEHPFMLINDVGMTFGRSDLLNRAPIESVNFKRWSETSVWKNDEGCVGNLAKSLTGSLHDPVIGEAGRQFLSSLLAQLTDRQLHDLFEVSRFMMRVQENGDEQAQAVSIDAWVSAFKQKRDDIAARHCS